MAATPGTKKGQTLAGEELGESLPGDTMGEDGATLTVGEWLLTEDSLAAWSCNM